MARPVYHRLKAHVPDHDIGAAEDKKRCRERELQSLQKTAAKLGSTLALAGRLSTPPALFLSRRCSVKALIRPDLLPLPLFPSADVHA